MENEEQQNIKGVVLTPTVNINLRLQSELSTETLDSTNKELPSIKEMLKTNIRWSETNWIVCFSEQQEAALSKEQFLFQQKGGSRWDILNIMKKPVLLFYPFL